MPEYRLSRRASESLDELMMLPGHSVVRAAEAIRWIKDEWEGATDIDATIEDLVSDLTVRIVLLGELVEGGDEGVVNSIQELLDKVDGARIGR